MLDNHLVRHNRKYLGLGLTLNEREYFLPLSSPDPADFKPDGTVRRTIVPIFRMFQADGTFLGKILLNNMIPAPTAELTYYDIAQETDQKYKLLVLDELRVIRRDIETIKKNARILYNQKTRGVSGGKAPGYLNATVDFAALERACDCYASPVNISLAFAAQETQ